MQFNSRGFYVSACSEITVTPNTLQGDNWEPNLTFLPYVTAHSEIGDYCQHCKATSMFWTREQWQVQESELPSTNTAKCQIGRAPTVREMSNTPVRNANGQEMTSTSANQRSLHPGMSTQERTHGKKYWNHSSRCARTRIPR